MSAWIVSKAHIDLLVGAALKYAHSVPELVRYNAKLAAKLPRGCTPTQLGQILWRENHASIAARYLGEGDPARADAYAFAHPKQALVDDALAVLKSIDCYEYQSCEHEGWEKSGAKLFCDMLRKEAVQHLPGYDNAPWGIE